MRTNRLSSLVIGLALFVAFGFTGQTQSIESMPPVVIKTVPESGSKDVPVGETEIRVTFSKEMQDKNLEPRRPDRRSRFRSCRNTAIRCR